MAPMADQSEATVPVPEDELAAILDRTDEQIQVSRHGFRQTDRRIALRPALADRPAT